MDYILPTAATRQKRPQSCTRDSDDETTSIEVKSRIRQEPIYVEIFDKRDELSSEAVRLADLRSYIPGRYSGSNVRDQSMHIS